MRWIVLALSLGATIVSLIHGVLAIWQLASDGGAMMTWTTTILLLASAVIALIGGILAFNRRKTGGIFIVAAALICLFIHPSTRIYGFVLLVGGILAFFVRSHYEYEYEEYEIGDDEEYGDEDETDEEQGGKKGRNIFGTRSFSAGREDVQDVPYGGKRRERASAIHPDREEYSLNGDVSKMDEPPRIRSSKVCPACGASVGIEHLFCHTCGKPLQGAPLQGSRITADPAGPAAEPLTYTESSAAFRDFQKTSLIDTPKFLLDDAQPGHRGNYEEEPEVADVLAHRNRGKYDEEEFEQDNPRDEIPMPHRVFVKPSGEDEIESKSPFMVGPDDSYEEFSKYTRRRKRRRNSLTRRILGPLILLLAVSGAAWLLLGLRKVPEPVPPTPPIEEPPAHPIEPVIVPPEPSIWERIQLEDPTRGVVTGSNVNVRQNHSTTGQIVTKLNAGARGELLERWEGVSGALSGPWFRIRSDGREGWIYGLYFQPLDGRQTTLPNGYTAALLQSFGSGKTELTEQLRQPTRQTSTTMTWTGLTIELRGDNNVVRMQVTGAQHVLQNGITVGMTDEVLYKNIGYPSDYRSGQLRYVESAAGGSEQGMSVRLQNGKVQSITVGNI